MDFEQRAWVPGGVMNCKLPGRSLSQAFLLGFLGCCVASEEAQDAYCSINARTQYSSLSVVEGISNGIWIAEIRDLVLAND